jgi:hypothetical protein
VSVARAAKQSRQSWVLYAIIVLLVGSFALPFYLDHRTTLANRSTIKCVNAALDDRSGPQAKDNAALRAWIASQSALAAANGQVEQALLDAIAATTDAQKTHATAEFITALGIQAPVAAAARAQTAATVQTLNVDQAFRDAHPLGHC